MALLRRIRSVHAIAVYRTGTGVGQIPVPHLVGVLRQRNPLELAFSRAVEKAQLYFRRIRGEEREVDAQPIPRRAERVGQAFGYTRALRAAPALLSGFCSR